MPTKFADIKVTASHTFHNALIRKGGACPMRVGLSSERHKERKRMSKIFQTRHLLPLGSLFFAVLLPCVSAAQSSPPSFIPSLNAEEGHSIPIVYDPILTPLPVVQVSIDGEPPLPFVLDTGFVYPVVLEKWAAEKLNLKSNGQIIRDTDGTKKGDVADVDRIELVGSGSDKPLIAPLKTVGIVDTRLPTEAYAGQKLAGIVGLPLLGYTTIRFDFAAKTLTLFMKPHPPLQVPGALNTPLHFGRPPDFRCYLTVKYPDVPPFDMIVDTGSLHSSLPASVVEHFARLVVARSTTTEWTLEGVHRENTVLFQSFNMEDLAEPNVFIDAEDTPSHPALLGMNLLSRFRVTLDIPNQRMTLEHAADYKEKIRLPGMSGLTLIRKDGQYQVDKVMADTPAAKAGIQTNAKVIQVDGHSLSSLPPTLAQELLDGFADTNADVIVANGDRSPEEVHFLRQAKIELPQPPKTGIGIAAGLTDEGKLIVNSVAAHSPAEAAGIQPGDEIIEINGSAVAKMSVPQIVSAVKEPNGGEIILKVKHKGEEMPREVHVKTQTLYP